MRPSLSYGHCHIQIYSCCQTHCSTGSEAKKILYSIFNFIFWTSTVLTGFAMYHNNKSKHYISKQLYYLTLISVALRDNHETKNGTAVLSNGIIEANLSKSYITEIKIFHWTLLKIFDFENFEFQYQKYLTTRPLGDVKSNFGQLLFSTPHWFFHSYLN